MAKSENGTYLGAQRAIESGDGGFWGHDGHLNPDVRLFLGRDGWVG